MTWLAIDKRPSPRKFAGVADWVAAELDAARLRYRENPTPYWHSANVIKRCAYLHGRTLLAGHRLEELKAFLKQRDGAGARANLNPFVWTLRLLSELSDAPSASDQAKYAVQLRYAYVNNVKASVVDLFLSGAGGYELIREKVHAGFREDWAIALSAKRPAVAIDPGTKAPKPKRPILVKQPFQIGSRETNSEDWHDDEVGGG